MSFRFHCCWLLACALAGCGTTRWTDTSRTATEQMLISDAIERAVSRLEFHQLDGQSVYLDTSFLTNVVDRDYLISSLRQHLVACGCVLKNERSDADFIVEARAGAVGTDRHDLLYGIPALNLPISPIQGVPTATPEIAFARRTDQKGVAKIAAFVYHRATGEPVWQSGVDTVASKAQDSWFLGMGPLQKGTIYDRAQFAGRELRFPLVAEKKKEDLRTVRVTRETQFNDPTVLALRHQGDELAKFGEKLEVPPDENSDLARSIRLGQHAPNYNPPPESASIPSTSASSFVTPGPGQQTPAQQEPAQPTAPDASSERYRLFDPNTLPDMSVLR